MDLTKIGRLQNILKKQELDAALVASTANLFYFTGTVPAGYLYIPAEGNPKPVSYTHLGNNPPVLPGEEKRAELR